MAKSSAKPAAKTVAKTTATKSKTASTSSVSVEKISEDALRKLQELGIEQQLQSDLEWCLGSYRNDNNPSGLYEMLERSRVVLNAEKEKKTKGVTAKLIGDIDKALKSK